MSSIPLDAIITAHGMIRLPIIVDLPEFAPAFPTTARLRGTFDALIVMQEAACARSPLRYARHRQDACLVINREMHIPVRERHGVRTLRVVMRRGARIKRQHVF